MAATQRTRTTRTGPPADRKNINTHLTPDFRADLTILMSTGATATDAIRTAVRDRADAYRRAWDYGDVPPGTAPHITGCTYQPAPPDA